MQVAEKTVFHFAAIVAHTTRLSTTTMSVKEERAFRLISFQLCL